MVADAVLAFDDAHYVRHDTVQSSPAVTPALDQVAGRVTKPEIRFCDEADVKGGSFPRPMVRMTDTGHTYDAAPIFRHPHNGFITSFGGAILGSLQA